MWYGIDPAAILPAMPPGFVVFLAPIRAHKALTLARTDPLP